MTVLCEATIQETSKARRDPRWVKLHRRLVRFRLLRERSFHKALWRDFYVPMKRDWLAYAKRERVYERLWTMAQEWRRSVGKAADNRPLVMVRSVVAWPFEEPTTETGHVLVRELMDTMGGVATITEQAITGRPTAQIAMDFRLRNPDLEQRIAGAAGKVKVGPAKTQVENIQRTLATEFFEKGHGIADVRRGFARHFEDAYRGQGRLIARTEIKNITAEANMDAMVHNGIGWKTWYAAGGEPCDLCGPLDGETVSIDETFSNGWSGEGDSHPGCMCMVVPARGPSG